MIRTALLLALAAALAADDGVPLWVLTGIAAEETGSYWQDGRLVYVNRRDGSAGERGPFQVTAAAFRQVARPGEAFARLRYDMDFATDIACRYLLWLRRRCSSWERAVACYNAGLGGNGWGYERRVEAAARR